MGTVQFEIPMPRVSFLFNLLEGWVASMAAEHSVQVRGFGNQTRD